MPTSIKERQAEWHPDAMPMVSRFIETEDLPVVEEEISGITLVNLDLVPHADTEIAQELLWSTGKEWRIDRILWRGESEFNEAYMVVEYHATEVIRQGT